MSEEDDAVFEILPAGEMREKYGLYSEQAPKITLDPKRIPKALWPLIACAEVWGITDDLMRADLVEKAGNAAITVLRATIAPYEDELDLWLAGPEASARHPSPEYLAFSCMRMAADGA